MRRPSSLFRSLALLLGAASIFVGPAVARAQSCCAGSGALTPGRLAMHERALVGLQLKASTVYGSFDGAGSYMSSPSGTSEYDFEQALFGAVRFLGDGQFALLVPVEQTRRAAPAAATEIGGGIGDVNASVRWDLVAAGESKRVPGVGLLAGVTLPTGRPPEEAHNPLASDATGIGALQANAGIAFEQTFGPWLVNVTGLVAQRAPRNVQGVRSLLGTQMTALGAIAYSFDNDSALAFVGSYTFERDAQVNGVTVPDSGRRVLRLSGAGTYPFAAWWRLQGSLFIDPPAVGQNQPTSVGLTLAVIRSWS